MWCNTAEGVELGYSHRATEAEDKACLSKVKPKGAEQMGVAGSGIGGVGPLQKNNDVRKSLEVLTEHS